MTHSEKRWEKKEGGRHVLRHRSDQRPRDEPEEKEKNQRPSSSPQKESKPRKKCRPTFLGFSWNVEPYEWVASSPRSFPFPQWSLPFYSSFFTDFFLPSLYFILDSDSCCFTVMICSRVVNSSLNSLLPEASLHQSNGLTCSIERWTDWCQTALPAVSFTILDCITFLDSIQQTLFFF